MKNNSSKNIHFSIRLDAVLDSQIKAYARANGLEKPDAVRQLLSSKCNDLSTELLQIKTAVNISAIETAETKTYVAKVTDILLSKFPTIDQNISDLTKKIDSLGKFLKTIAEK